MVWSPPWRRTASLCYIHTCPHQVLKATGAPAYTHITDYKRPITGPDFSLFSVIFSVNTTFWLVKGWKAPLIDFRFFQIQSFMALKQVYRHRKYRISDKIWSKTFWSLKMTILGFCFLILQHKINVCQGLESSRE